MKVSSNTLNGTNFAGFNGDILFSFAVGDPFGFKFFISLFT